jgi:Protein CHLORORESPIRATORY REDUCTION 7
MAALQHQEDYFVVLETDQPEVIVTATEIFAKLAQIIQTKGAAMPPGLGLEQFATVTAQAQHLLDTVCELDFGPAEYLQWYAVRLEK